MKRQCCKCGNVFKTNNQYQLYCDDNCTIIRNCKRCDQQFDLRYPDKRECCSQTCEDLLLVRCKCTACNEPFYRLSMEVWKKQCGRTTCYQSMSSHSTYPTSSLSDVQGTSITAEVETDVITDNLVNKKRRKYKGYSSKCIVWLEMLIQLTHTQIQHEKNGGEVTVSYTDQSGKSSYIQVDGYDRSTNTVYEFNGNYWHGNPRMYDSGDINPSLNVTYGSLYEKTKQRERLIRSLGYNLIVLWEDEYDSLVLDSRLPQLLLCYKDGNVDMSVE